MPAVPLSHCLLEHPALRSYSYSCASRCEIRHRPATPANPSIWEKCLSLMPRENGCPALGFVSRPYENVQRSAPPTHSASTARAVTGRFAMNHAARVSFTPTTNRLAVRPIQCQKHHAETPMLPHRGFPKKYNPTLRWSVCGRTPTESGISSGSRRRISMSNSHTRVRQRRYPPTTRVIQPPHK